MTVGSVEIPGRAVALAVAALLVVPAVWLALVVKRANQVPPSVYLAPEYSAYKLPPSEMMDPPQR